MTFDYTQARLVTAVPDLSIKGPTGPVTGVLPVLLRLDWGSAENIHGFARTLATRQILNDIIARRASEGVNPSGERAHKVMPPPYQAPFHDKTAAERWRDGRRRPSRTDIEDLLARLEQNDFLSWFANDQAQLIDWLDALAERAATREDMPADLALRQQESLLRYLWDDSGRLRLSFYGFRDPYDRARIEAMAAYTEGRPGLVRCDVCDRWFVPVRAGRPSRRCPGFECSFQAQQRYQQSPERREYRRLSMRISRARSSGDRAALEVARQELDEFKRRTQAEHRKG